MNSDSIVDSGVGWENGFSIYFVKIYWKRIGNLGIKTLSIIILM